MRQIFVDFVGDDGILVIDEFEAGTNDRVNVSLDASCCIRQATVGMLDVAGNSNRTTFDQGPFRSTSIYIDEQDL